MGRLRPRLTYANVMATLAFFVAVGGGAYAGVVLPNNSVKSPQIAPGAVKTTDIGNNAVTSAKVKNRTLLAVDFKAGQLPAGAKGDKGDTGAIGPKGDTGAQGAQGIQGIPGPVNIVFRRQEEVISGAGLFEVTPGCNAGERVIGGGGGFIASGTDAYTYTATGGSMINNGPRAAGAAAIADQGTPSGWIVSARNDSGAKRLVGFAICIQ